MRTFGIRREGSWDTIFGATTSGVVIIVVITPLLQSLVTPLMRPSPDEASAVVEE